MKETVNPFDYSAQLLAQLRSGVLLATKADGKANIMTIGWGFLGIDWSAPVFMTLVRIGRYTRELLDKNPEFAICAPMGEFDKKILAIAGTKSGRDMDKIAALNLTLEPGEKISVPAIRELPLTLECKVIYRQAQDLEAIPPNLRETFYPAHVDSSNPRANRDYHIAYYGEIVAAYILK